MKTQKQPTAATTSVTTNVAPSANWSRAMPPGPDRHVKITKEYAKALEASPPSQQFECYYCKQRFPSQSELIAHMDKESEDARKED